jgi:quercetin dioxygenase-like cupin family protein
MLNHLKSITASFGTIAMLAVAPFANSQEVTIAKVQLTPAELAQLAYEGQPNGIQTVTLAGDQRKPGLYTYRVKFSAGLKVPPHSHPENRMVTVISGTLYFGHGEEFDESKLAALPPGSFYAEPARQPHFVWAKSGEVIIQVTGVGPTENIPVKPPTK